MAPELGSGSIRVLGSGSLNMAKVSPEDIAPASSPASPSTPKLELKGISKEFRSRGRQVQALGTCDLQIAAKEFVTIVGPSGCGKSTLMMIAAGLERQTTGEVRVDGKLAGPPGPQRSVVFQKFALFPSKTVEANIGFGLRARGVKARERAQRIDEQLELMDLAQFRKSYPHELSGGMQQRVAIARSLAMRPDILLMDEPFGALDAQTRALLQEEIARLRDIFHYTVLFITHSVEEAVYLGDRVVVMTRRPGTIKKIVEVPRDAAWRSFDIETALGYEDFSSTRQRIWGMVREEISREQ